MEELTENQQKIYNLYLKHLALSQNRPYNKRKDFSNISDDAFGVNFIIANASSTFLPLIRSATIFTFLLDILAYLNVAFASSVAV